MAPEPRPDGDRTGSAARVRPPLEVPHSAASRVGIRRLRTELASLVHRAERGERTVVTLDGRPVAQLTSLGREHHDKEDLLATGSLLRPRDGGRPRLPRPRRPVTEMTTDSALALIRGGR